MELNDYSAIANEVWTAQTSEDKRDILLRSVANFKAKGKDQANVKKFQKSIRDADSPGQLDRIAAQLALFPNNRVI